MNVTFGNIEIGLKSIKKRTPIVFKKIGDSFLAFAMALQAYTVIVLSDPQYMAVLNSYVPQQYTRIATLVCVVVKIITMFTSKADEKPIYPPPQDLKK